MPTTVNHKNDLFFSYLLLVISNSVLPELKPPLEELELLDGLLLDRFATANDDGTETWLSAIFMMNDLHQSSISTVSPCSNATFPETDITLGESC